MGSCASQDPEVQQSKSITEELKKTHKSEKKVKKILFLGSGGSGKTTIFKQLRSIHGKGFTDDDKKEYIPHIQSQMFNQMKLALHFFVEHQRKQTKAQKLNKGDGDDDEEYNLIDKDKDEDHDSDDDYYDVFELKIDSALTNMEACDKILTFDFNSKIIRNKETMPEDVWDALDNLWNENVVQQIYAHRNITKLEDTTKYFYEKISEIRQLDWMPAEQDIVFLRLPTTGIHEQQFEVKNDKFMIIDVGGQRSERRKWLHCFEKVVALIFVASLSCFDEVLAEDHSVNAMDDQLQLFHRICNDYNSLQKVHYILFLNKKDLFQEKLAEGKSILQCSSFNEYQTIISENKELEFDVSNTSAFIKTQFEIQNQSKSKEVFIHLTCAADKDNVDKVFRDVQVIIVSAGLDESGFAEMEDDDGYNSQSSNNKKRAQSQSSNLLVPN